MDPEQHALPRFQAVDATWSAVVRQSYEANLARHLAALQDATEARRIHAWNSVAHDRRQLALVLYATGEPLGVCRRLLLESARAHLEVVRLRGTEQSAANDPRFVPPTEYSKGNSRVTYLAICMALIGGDMDLARALAPLVWDPPDANYVGPKSVLCTTSQQALAYALRYLLVDMKDQALAQLHRLTRVTGDVVGEMLMLRGLVEADSARMADGLRRELDWHAAEASERTNYRVARYFLCIPALGLTALAQRDGLLDRDKLPADDVYFPIDLIA
jgi:hypothetical protein